MTLQTATTNVINGFSVVRVKLRETCRSSHCLYVKPHAVRETDAHRPKQRTLFVINVPASFTQEVVQRLFAVCGPVVSVQICQHPTNSALGTAAPASQHFPACKLITGFRVAYVVFRKQASVKAALSMTDVLIASTDQQPILTGIAKWCEDYEKNTVNEKELQAEIDGYMQIYDNKMEKEKETAREMEGMADADGWVTVTRHGRKPVTARTDAQMKRIMQKEKRKKKRNELLNFYSFQSRDSKREHIAELRRKFEEDKQKIAQLKAARKFKPF